MNRGGSASGRRRCTDGYALQVAYYDEKNNLWEPLDEEETFGTLADVKKALYYDYDFYCEANARIDNRGNEVFQA